MAGKHGKKPYPMLNAYDGMEIPQFGYICLLICYVHTIDDENPGPIIIGKCSNEAVEIITVNAVAEMIVCSEPKNIQDAHALKLRCIG